MKITFSNQNHGTSVSLSDDNLTEEGEIMLDCYADGNETWYSFTSFKEFNDFAEAVEIMRNRFKKHLGGN